MAKVEGPALIAPAHTEHGSPDALRIRAAAIDHHCTSAELIVAVECLHIQVDALSLDKTLPLGNGSVHPQNGRLRRKVRNTC
ncbi:hypothetical protein D3C84_1116030 [compost metagenome]